MKEKVSQDAHAGDIFRYTAKKENEMMGTEKTSAKLLITFIFILIFVPRSFAGLDSKTTDTVTLHSMVVNNAYELEGGRQKQFIVVDARAKEKYAEAHIFSSVSIPENDFEKSKNLLPRDKGALLIVYCDNAKSDLSNKWANKAAAAGYLNVVIYKEGFQIWEKNNMPIAPLNSIGGTSPK